MKKVSISILIILMSLLFVSFTNIDSSSSNLYLEDDSLYIADGNMSYKVSIKNNVYMMDGLDYSDTAVYVLDDNVYIGIKTTYQEDIYTVEVMSLADNYTIFTTTDDTIYNYLVPLREKINYYSDLAQQITEYSWDFSEYHYKDEQKPSIGTMSMDRNNRTIKQMTSTDSYLDGYKRMDIEHGYKITYQDPIINIVPESWLFTTGIKSYVGKEYAVIVNTIRQSETSTYGGPYYKSHVSVFDIEIGLPIKPDVNNADYSKNHLLYAPSRETTWEIKPKFSNVYDSIRKSEMLQLSNWTRQFDITENQITISRSYDASLQKYFIAPKYLAISINNFIDENDNLLEDKNFYGFLNMEYSVNLVSNSYEEYIDKGNFDFYNTDGVVVSSADYEIIYAKQNTAITGSEIVTLPLGELPKAYTTNGFLDTYLELNNRQITTGIYSTYTGLVELMVYNYTTSSGFSVDVYDSDGKLVTSKGITRGDSLELIFNLEYDKLYAIKINFYGSLSDVDLEINKITSAPTQINGNFTFEVSTQDINKTVYLRFDLTKVGLYRFMSHTYNNPDIKIYDENCNLLQESYDVAEDDYSFNTVYYNKNNRSIIVEIYTHSADTFDVDIEYFAKWSGQ